MAQRRLTDQGRERKQQLLDQAALLFAERGYSDTRVVDICEAAGVAKGLFYWYFENKEALFADLVRSMQRRLRQAQAGAMEPDADPLTRMRQGTEASVRFLAQHRSFFSLLELERGAPEVSRVLREGRDAHVADTERQVRAAQEAGLVDDGEDAHLLAIAIVATVATFSHFHRSGRIDLDVEDLAAFVARATERLVAGEVPARTA